MPIPRSHGTTLGQLHAKNAVRRWEYGNGRTSYDWADKDWHVPEEVYDALRWFILGNLGIFVSESAPEGETFVKMSLHFAILRKRVVKKVTSYRMEGKTKQRYRCGYVL
jgi:hypothetical protein